MWLNWDNLTGAYHVRSLFIRLVAALVESESAHLSLVVADYPHDYPSMWVRVCVHKLTRWVSNEIGREV